LPAWLSFDAANLIFTGTPQNGDVTDANGIDIKVTVDDNNQGVISDVFNLIVVDTNDPPTDIGLTSNTVGENVVNGTIVGVLSAVDPDVGDSHTFSITGDNSNGGFGIQGNQLVVADTSRLDYETSSTHSVFLQVTDRFNVSLPQPKEFIITLMDQNDLPEIILPPLPITVVENTTTVITLQGNDQDGDPIGFTLAGGVDTAQFALLPGDELHFASAPDFEAPADANGDNIYELLVNISDGVGPSVATPISVEVVDAPEAPVITSSAILNATQGQLYQYDVQVADDDLAHGDRLTFSLTVNPAGMSIDPDTGMISWTPSNAQVASSPHDVNVHTQDNGGLFDDQPFQIAVKETNERPTDLQLDVTEIGENVAPGTSVGRFTVTDPDIGDSHDLSIVDDPSNAFDIGGANSDELIVSAPDNLDFETVPAVTIQVQATDSGGLGISPVPSFTITISNQNDPPVLPPQAFSVVENTVIPQPNSISFSDEDQTDIVSVSITGGPDAGLFSLVPDTGELTFQAAPNFETPTDANQDNVYLIQVTANDGNVPVASQMTITVSNANDQPQPGDDTYTVDEGGSISIPDLLHQPPFDDLLSNDVDEDSDPLLVSLLSGPAHAAAFTLNPDGSFTYTHDGSETTSDTFTYLVDDQSGEPNATASATVTIDVTPQNDPPEIVDPAPEGQVTVSMAEDGYNISLDQAEPFVLTLNANDPENNPLTWNINVDPNNGSASVIGDNTSATINYTPDADYNGQDQFDVLVDDQMGGTDSIQVIVDISSQNDTPVFSVLPSQTHFEGETIAPPLDASATDVDGDTLVYSATGLPPTLAIDPNTGQISGTIDIGAVGDYTNIVIYANDQSSMPNAQGQSAPFSWSVLFNQNPIADITQPVDGITVNINEDIILDASGSSDPDNHVPLDYQWEITGTVNSVINGVNATVNFSNAGVYDVVLTVTDSLGKQDQANITINVNTPPTGATLTPATVPENSPAGTVVGTLSAIDPDIGDTHTFTMATGGDAGGRFAISGNQVMVADGSQLNYEAASSHNITVEVKDLGGTGTPVNQPLTINISDANDPPVITYPIQQPRQQIINTDGDSISISLSATDEDTGDTLKFDSTTLPPGLTIDPAGLISGSLNVGASTNSPYIVDFTVDDQQGQPNSTTAGSFEWVVNPLPLAGLFTNAALESCLLSYGWTNAHEVTGTVSCEGQNITELDGMEYLVNVNELQLSNNQVTDLSPLKGLDNLQILNVSNNQISDLSSLGPTDLVGLNTLYLNGNPVQDVGGLKDLPNLIELRLSALTATVVNTSDIAGLTDAGGFSSLERLWLQDNSLSGLSGLENRSNLKELWISGNALSDISTVSNLSNLTILDLGGNIVEDVSGLESLANLTLLDLNNNTLGASATGNVDKLTSLVNLQTLDLTNNPSMSCRQLQTLIDTRGASPTGPVSPGAPIPGSNCTEPLATLFSATNGDLQSCMDQLMAANPSWLLGNDVTGTFACNNMTNGDLSGMEYLVNLMGFEADNSNISDISLLASLAGLTVLRLDGNDITDLSALSSTDGTTVNTPLLQELHLANNSGIADFTPLALLNQLTYLDLENTGIDDITVLSSNVALVTLNLSNNQIQDVTGLGSLTALETLQLANNKIKDVNSIASLVNLITLDLQGNQIGNGVQGFVDRLSVLTLATINLTGNSLISCGELQLLYNSPTRPVIVGATCIELPADPDKTTATLIKPHDPLLKGDRVTIRVQARDVYGNPKTQGGEKVEITITGANPHVFSTVLPLPDFIEDYSNGFYAKVYWVNNAGTDHIEIKLGDPGQPIKGDYADGIYIENINTPPTASIIQPALNSMDIWPGTQVAFEATAADAEDTLGSGLTVKWVFDGGDIPGASTLGPHTITFSTAGKYTVTFTATDSVGTQSQVKSKTIVVGDPWGASQPELIESIDSAAQQPKIAIDNTNNVIATWSQYWPSTAEQNITINRYDATVGAWEVEKYIDTDVSNAFYPKIIMTSDGDAIVVWAQRDAYPYSTIWSNHYNSLTSTWGTPMQVDSNARAMYEFDIAQNYLGDVMAIWHETDPVSLLDNVLVNHYSFGSGLWDSQLDLVGSVSGNNSVYKTEISMSNSDNALALWSENISGGNTKIYGNSFIPGNSWGTETVLEPEQGTSSPPQLILFDNGDGLAVWSQNVRSTTGTIIGQALMASRYTVSSDTWNVAQQVHYEAGYYDAYHQLAIDNNGNVTIIWMADRSPPIPDHLFSIRYNSNTGVWGTVQQVDQYGMGNQYPALAVDTLGNVIAVWHSPNKYSVWANKYDIDTQTWGVPKLLENDDSGLAGDAQIVIGSDDVGVVVWRQEFGNNVYDIFSTRLDPQP
jgi:VCBS repeat-containing protein